MARNRAPRSGRGWRCASCSDAIRPRQPEAFRTRRKPSKPPGCRSSDVAGATSRSCEDRSSCGRAANSTPGSRRSTRTSAGTSPPTRSPTFRTTVTVAGRIAEDMLPTWKREGAVGVTTAAESEAPRSTSGTRVKGGAARDALDSGEDRARRHAWRRPRAQRGPCATAAESRAKRRLQHMSRGRGRRPRGWRRLTGGPSGERRAATPLENPPVQAEFVARGWALK